MRQSASTRSLGDHDIAPLLTHNDDIRLSARRSVTCTRRIRYAHRRGSLRCRPDTDWWAHLVGALRVSPHKHCATHPQKKNGGRSGPASVPVTVQKERGVGDATRRARSQQPAVRATRKSPSGLFSPLDWRLLTREHHRIAVEAGASRAAGQRVARARIHSPVNRIVAETARPATARDLGPRSPEWRTN